MAQPRKFAEKIALHNQKQAEETAAFEAIMKEVGAIAKLPKKNLNVQQNLGTYIGGSLPNVNQIGSSNAIDLQSALHSLEDMKQSSGRQSLTEKLQRDRARQLHRQGQQMSFDRRIDTSPYKSGAYLSPPPDSNWRRANSDSALHASVVGQPMSAGQAIQGTSTPPTYRRGNYMYSPFLGNEIGGENMQVSPSHLLDPKKQLGQGRPRSCEVPGINIFPSPEQEVAQVANPAHNLPISNNTGSLPDLTNLQFQSPLVQPLDTEDNTYPTGALSPTTAHHLAQRGTGQNSSPAQRRRQQTGAPSPLVLSSSPTQHNRHNVPMQGCVLDGRIINADSSLRHQQFHPYHIHHHPQQAAAVSPSPLPISPPQQQQQQQTSPQHAPSPPQALRQRLHPQVSNLKNQQGGTVSQYRNGQPECPASPSSPISQQSYSPSQSPNNLSPSMMSGSPFSEAYYLQQQQQTNAMQHQFEQFSMQLQENQSASTDGVYISNIGLSNLQFSQANMEGLSGSQEFKSPPQYSYSSSPSNSGMNTSHPTSPTASQQSPSSPQQQQQQQQQTQQHQQSQSSNIAQMGPEQIAAILQQQSQQQQLQQGKIPDIIFTGDDLTNAFNLWCESTQNQAEGVDDAFSRQDFAKDIGNAMAGMSDSFVDTDFFGADEALKMGLDPLDLDGLQMLTDSSLVTDPATEDSFRLNRL